MSRLFGLVTLLEAYSPSSAEERTLAEMLLLARAPGDAFSRYVYDPGHFTASGFVVSPDGADVLLVHHRRFDRWLQPGGHVDPGDTGVREAATREIAEETGVDGLLPLRDGIFDVDVHGVRAHRGEPAHRHFDVRFVFRAATRDLVVAEEVHDAAWVPIADLLDTSSDRSVTRPVRRLAAPGGLEPGPR
jgi:8-oxo-dGTP pyrophosphatase MutT (NUDIX family)